MKHTLIASYALVFVVFAIFMNAKALEDMNIEASKLVEKMEKERIDR